MPDMQALATSGPNSTSGPRLLTAVEAAALIGDEAVIATSGFNVMGVPEEILRALEERFLASDHPRGLTILHSASQSDRVNGVQRLCHEGMLGRVIGSHWGLAPRLGEFIAQDRCEAYCLPQGQMVHLFRAMAAGRPGLLSPIGLRTFIDPRLGGGKMNARTRARPDLVRLAQVDGQEYLFYKSIPPDFAIIRGTAADSHGNVTLDEEAVILEQLSIAQAVHNNGGTVIAQVKRIVPYGTIHPKRVAVPGVLVDVLVEARSPEVTHRQMHAAAFDPAYSGDARSPLEGLAAPVLDARLVAARRGALELRPRDVVNLGIGIPGDAVGQVVAQEGLGGMVTVTVESGAYGGVPAGGVDFGAVMNADALIDHGSQFDFYDGGGADVTFMGCAQVGANGDVNVSLVSGRAIGCGGFIDLTQSARQVCFLMTFTSGGLEVSINDGNLRVIREGSHRKFVDSVDQVTFSGSLARERRQSVLYISERAVFALGPEGLALIEIAPGIDVERDVLAMLPRGVIVSPKLRQMDSRIFRPEAMEISALVESRGPRSRSRIPDERLASSFTDSDRSLHPA
jgi:propionate CoA-transferase